jgi:hypothetical protein
VCHPKSSHHMFYRPTAHLCSGTPCCSFRRGSGCRYNTDLLGCSTENLRQPCGDLACGRLTSSGLVAAEDHPSSSREARGDDHPASEPEGQRRTADGYPRCVRPEKSGLPRNQAPRRLDEARTTLRTDGPPRRRPKPR